MSRKKKEEPLFEQSFVLAITIVSVIFLAYFAHRISTTYQSAHVGTLVPRGYRAVHSRPIPPPPPAPPSPASIMESMNNQ